MGKEFIGSLELNRIYQWDCIEGMRALPDDSIDLIVIDPPYNIGKDARWDSYREDEYLTFMSLVFNECERVLKPNGSFYWWHNDMLMISKLMTEIENRTSFIFNSFITWDKGDWRALSWKNPSGASSLKSWFNTSEYVLYYTFQNKVSSKTIKDDYVVINNPFRKELIRARSEAKMTVTEVAERGKFYGKVNHGGSVTNWEKGYNIPTYEQWEILKEFLPVRAEYDELSAKYKSLIYTHNLDQNHNNIWRYNTENRGKYHPCQKPMVAMERIIRTSSNRGDVVLDCFGGSGTTFVAAKRLGRKWIGFEREPEYIEVTNQRLEAIQDTEADDIITKESE